MTGLSPVSKIENPALSVVIVNWNTREMLKSCLELIPGSAGSLDFEVIIVDNGSSDGSQEMIQSQFPEVNLIGNDNNLGFSKAVNQGIMESRGRFVALVNSDIMMHPGVLVDLVEELEHRGDLGAVGPQLVGSDGQPQQSGGFAPSPVAVLKQFAGAPRLWHKSGHGIGVWSLSGEPMGVDWLCGALMVIRKEALDQVGMLDDSYFMYAEDMEFGLRLKAAGWGSELLSAIKVEHLRGGSGAAKAPEVKLLWLGGIFRVASGRLGRISYALFGVLMAIDLFLKSLLSGVSRGAASGDLRLFARTSLRLALRRPGFATEFYQGLGRSSRNRLNQAL